MKELSGRRINFLDRQQSAITYKTMIFGALGWVVFLALVYVLLLIRAAGMRSDIALSKKMLDDLNASKDKQIEMVAVFGARKTGSAGKDDITAIMQMRPRWADILKVLVRSLPSQVWLDSVAAEPAREGGYDMSIRGRSQSQRALTSFILQMESSGAFRHTALVGTREIPDRGGTEYEINTSPILKRY